MGIAVKAGVVRQDRARGRPRSTSRRTLPSIQATARDAFSRDPLPLKLSENENRNSRFPIVDPGVFLWACYADGPVAPWNGVYSPHAGCQNGNPGEIGKSKEIVIYGPPIQTKRACIGAIAESKIDADMLVVQGSIELKGRILWVSLSITEARTGGSVLISGSHLTAPQARRLPGC